jgi:YD repeat-containing protein
MSNTISPWFQQNGTGRWRLTQVKDRFGNSVNIQYSTTASYPEVWTVNDGVRTQTVYFAAAPAASPTQANFYSLTLDHVVLTTFGAPAEGARTWTMAYDNQWLGSANPPHGTFVPYFVPLLTTVTLPPVNAVSQTFSMRRPDGTTFYGINASQNLFTNGGLMGMQLPTKGWIEWDYVTETFLHAREIGNQRSLAVRYRRTLSADRATTNAWTYDRAESADLSCLDGNNQPYSYGPEQLVVSVTSPESVTSVHYFSLFQEPAADPCVPAGGFKFDFNSYALPFTAGVTSTFGSSEQQYLSQETYLGTPSLATTPQQYRVSGGSRQRSEWSLYRGDDVGGTDHIDLLHKPESAHATEFDDDTQCFSNEAAPCRCGPNHDQTCYVSVARYGHDGAGHYRQSSTAGNFYLGTIQSGNFATTFTNYTGVSDSGAWLLNQFTEQCAVEDSVFRGAMPSQSCANLTAAPANGSILSGPFVKQFCFDNTTGFLSRQRTLAGAAPGAHDLLAIFSPQNGNVAQEDYFGGDTQSLGTETVCNATLPPTSEYQMVHTYSNGSLEKSYHRPKSGDPIIYEANNVIDPGTGLVSSSTDPSALTTSYTYDPLGRLTSVTRPGEAAVTATYTEATSTAGAQVKVEQASTDAGTMRSTTIFDGFGRIFEEQQLMPSGTAKRQTQYNGSGWVTAVSEWEAIPTHFTLFENFDPFGRAQRITPPGQLPTTVTYSGVRKVARSVSVGESIAGGVVQPATATTTEKYDRAGRLIEVDEPDGISKALYGYDAAGHLVNVNMSDTAAGTSQARSFSYDGRGFLLSEQHPENGTAYYKDYDSRGHVGRKLIGLSYTPSDLKYEYDALERLWNVYQLLDRADPPTVNSIRPVKQFNFASGNAGTNYRQGKLETATRKNYSPLETIDVKETYEYSDSAGRLTKKTTDVTGPSGLSQKYSQGYTYNDAGLFSAITYPTCPNGNCATSSLMTSSMSPTYQNGLLKTVPNFTTGVTYGLNGMVTQIAHAGQASVSDLITPDLNGLTRPARIQFNTYDACTRPQISLPSTKQVSAGSSPGLQAVTIGNPPTAPTTYQWLKDGAVLTSETTASCCATAPASGTYAYTARLINSCGKGEATTIVTVCGNPTVTVTPQNSTYSNNPVTLTATQAGGCLPVNYQWYVGDSGVTSSPTGGSSPTLTVSPQSTTHYWVRVTDNLGFTANSNTVIVTVASPLPTPGALTAIYNAGNNTISVTWGASAGADHYELQRLDHGTWTTSIVAGTNPPPYALAANTTYVFHVRAVDSSGGSASNYTANELATTMSFAALQSNVTVVNFDHFEQIRTAINYIRTAQNGAASPLTWQQILSNAGYASAPIPNHNIGIYAAHILALRNAMTTALAGVQIADPGYTDSLASPTVIHAYHITQLQQRAQ